MKNEINKTHVSEIVDGSTPRLVMCGRPWLQLCGHLQSPLIESQLGVRRLEIDSRRYQAFFHGQHHLDDSRQARGRLGMANIRLDRADPQPRFSLRRVRPKDGGDSACLDGITGRCACSVEFAS